MSSMSVKQSVLSASAVHQSFCIVLSLAWSVRNADSLVCSLGSLIIRFCKQTIVAGAFLFEQLSDFLICFIKPVLVFPLRKAHNFSRGFLWYGLHLLPLFFRLCSCHTLKPFSQHDMQIVFYPWDMKFVHLQFLHLGTVSLWRRLDGKGTFAANKPMKSVAVCPGHHCGV